ARHDDRDRRHFLRSDCLAAHRDRRSVVAAASDERECAPPSLPDREIRRDLPPPPRSRARRAEHGIDATLLGSRRPPSCPGTPWPVRDPGCYHLSFSLLSILTPLPVAGRILG